MEMSPDGTGAVGTGKFQTLKTDSLVMAVGQHADVEFLKNVPDVRIGRGNVVEVDAGMRASDGIFAGGDMIGGARTMTAAVGHGKKAARHIDAWLRGVQLAPVPKHAPATFDRLNTWYYSDAPKTVRPQLDLARRTSSFDEVQGGLTEDNALFEARRCLSCGNCFECDNCYGVCPDNAVVKLGPGNRFQFNYDYCKGCGVCVAECPCGAIEMVPEEG
jgi:2-oxoacid:acceptor oxidoreductase delta subunit (pyruvate/2-ketoisovalerate family)